MEVLFLVGSIQALFFAILVFSKQKRNDSDKILGFWLLMLGIHLLFPFLIYKNPEKYFNLGGVDACLFPMSGIWMFLYTKTMTSKDSRLRKKWLLNFLVVIPIIISLLPYYLSSPEQKMKMVHKQENINFPLILGAILNVGSFAFYVIASLYKLQKHKNSIRHEFSYEQNIDLKWLRNLVYSLIILGGVFVVLVGILALKQMHVYDVDFFFYLLLVVFVFGLGYWGFKQGKIFKYETAESGVIIGEPEKKVTEVEKSIQEKMANDLSSYMKKNKPYLNSQLSLYDLASSLDYSSHELSALLNKFLKINFYDFVNNYRVEEAKKRLKMNNQKFTVLAIAFDCGFNSKASFNRIFKQKTGLTPSEYVYKK